MEALLSRTLAEALERRAERPDAVPIADGTDQAVELDSRRTRPVAVVDAIDRDVDRSDRTIREALAAEPCRCTGYQKIVEAVRTAAERRS